MEEVHSSPKWDSRWEALDSMHLEDGRKPMGGVRKSLGSKIKLP